MITSTDVEKIASLSKLEISSEQLGKFTEQINHILGFIERLNQLDTSQIIPTSHAVETAQPLREDERQASQIRDQALQAAPEAESHLFRVPKVI